ncbi:hypothetical protein B0A48_14493 [Cryoendolithus antarcticus]|uniref:Uncharacterized protein n=1 Tax=Cryoendolithus antarcticus TaxID=1507870 RepID=A0A1V8SKX1_9PEZI|nr:hypothetical protein B0A48_14493 [Cryoendolithus antarcticus]
MSSAISIHVVNKSNNTLHHTVAYTPPSPAPPPQEGHITARASLISLTSNNLAYARLGSLWKWWDAYRVPSSLPSPYNEATQYGIVPTWGYGLVLSSRVPGLSPGTQLWGFWPSNSLLVDLKLVPDEPAGHWRDITENRAGMMSYYHRYQVAVLPGKISELSGKELEKVAWQTVFLPLFACGYWTSKYVLGTQPVHPFGAPGGEWTKDDADLSKAVVISLSASGKTARAFIDTLFHSRESGTGPLGFLAVTSKPDAEWLTSDALPSRAVAYADATSNETTEWIRDLHPSRIVIVDFGGRAGSLDSLMSSLKSSLPGASLKIIGIGGTATAMQSPSELAAFAKIAQIPERVQMNTSAVRDVLIERDGAKAVFEELDGAWKGFEGRAFAKGLNLKMGKGAGGEEGFEGGWKSLCEGKADAVDGLVYRMDA